MLVRDFSTPTFISLRPKDTIRDCLKAFNKHRIGIACVTDAEGHLEGIVTRYTLYRLLLSAHSLDDPIAPAIRREVVSFYENDTLEFAKDTFIKHNVAHGVVLDARRRVVGVMGQADIIRGFLNETELLLDQTHSLIEHLQDAVISVNPNFQVVTYNQTAEKLFGFPRHTVLGESIEDVFPELHEHFRLSIEEEKRMDSCRIRFNAVTVIGSFVPILDWGNVTGGVAVLKDMTSYEKVAKELETTKKLERTLDSALQLSYDGVLITDEHGMITKVNPAFLDIYQLEPNEVVGKPAWAVAPELPIQEVLSSKQRLESEIREIKGKKCIVTMHPIIRLNACEGAIAKIIFHKLDQWKDVFRRLEKLESELSYYRGELNRITQQSAFDRIISSSKAVESVKKEAYLAAQGFSNILITGESGTGKELFAEAIHAESGREGSFVKVNCAAIPLELLESEFFGYAEGAFTGARKGGKPGIFEWADRGTLFLDEIGDMPLSVQAKLLRVLQEQKFERLGETKTRQVDVRIIAATNKDLRKLVRQGTFREDLYYRIVVIHIHIPPLRDRPDDIPILAKHFIKKLNQKMDKQVIGVTPQTLDLLRQHHWTGNVRELENVLERAMHLGAGTWIEPSHLPDALRAQSTSRRNEVEGKARPGSSTAAVQAARNEITLDLSRNRRELLADTEKQAILQALEHTGGNRSRAAKRLGISRSALYQKLKKYGIKSETRFYQD